MPGNRRSSFQFLVFSIFQISAIMSNAIGEGPKFAEPIPNVTVALGRDASLPCVVENLGNYKVAWIHIDRQMILTIHRHVIARVSRFSVSHDNHKTWLLNVNQVHQEDRGYYMCQVNTNPMISQVGYLQVVVPPNIVDSESTPSSVAIRENQNVTLVCKAEGIPAPKLSWRREDGQPITIEKKTKVLLQEGEQLNLTRITRSEMGAYLCIASNSVPPSVSKRIIVDVEFSPMIWVPNQLVGAPAGTDVTIECNTEAYPKAISYWVYDGVMILPIKKYITDTQENSYRTYMRLTIKNLHPRDFGSYRCISKNSLGETEGSIRLYEIPSPSQLPRTTSDGNRAGKQGATLPSANIIGWETIPVNLLVVTPVQRWGLGTQLEYLENVAGIQFEYLENAPLEGSTLPGTQFMFSASPQPSAWGVTELLVRYKLVPIIINQTDVTIFLNWFTATKHRRQTTVSPKHRRTTTTKRLPATSTTVSPNSVPHSTGSHAEPTNGLLIISSLHAVYWLLSFARGDWD